MTFRQAEEYLLGLELFGMRFGLDRMHRLMTVLGMPQRRFASIHVVGSNGKSSTVRYAAAILERHGLRTGSYTSPHLRSFRERIEVGEEPVSETDFAAAVERAAHAAALVNRNAEPDDHVTQFEALTAAAYHELARRGVEVAVIEAGLGGRYDATNVIPSKVQVLTTVSLEHTRWLGPTLPDIADEKLAVVSDHGTLVAGDLDSESLAVAERVVAERHARLVRPAVVDDLPLRAAGGFQRGNFALAATAAQAFLGRPLDRAALVAAAAETVVPGRLEVVSRAPADGSRRRPQPLRRTRAGRVARRSARRAPAARGGDRRSRRQGRGRDAGGAAPVRRSGDLHALPEPALALAGHAHDARGEARRAPRRDRRRPARRARARS